MKLCARCRLQQPSVYKTGVSLLPVDHAPACFPPPLPAAMDRNDTRGNPVDPSWALPLFELTEHLAAFSTCKGGRSARHGMLAGLRTTATRTSTNTPSNCFSRPGLQTLQNLSTTSCSWVSSKTPDQECGDATSSLARRSIADQD